MELTDVYPKDIFNPSPANTGQAQRPPLFKNLRNINNRPHCLYWRPGIRQARKPANARNNLDG